MKELKPSGRCPWYGPLARACARARPDWVSTPANTLIELGPVADAKRKQWLVSRWVGLTQPKRDSFRAALDAADATRAEHTVALQRLTGALARSDIRLTRRPGSSYPSVISGDLQLGESELTHPLGVGIAMGPGGAGRRVLEPFGAP